MVYHKRKDTKKQLVATQQHLKPPCTFSNKNLTFGCNLIGRVVKVINGLSLQQDSNDKKSLKQEFTAH